MWRIWCVRSRHSQFGASAGWMKKGFGYAEFNSEFWAKKEADRLNHEKVSPNIYYEAREYSL